MLSTDVVWLQLADKQQTIDNALVTQIVKMHT